MRAPNWVGDVVLSLPALRDLRRRLPGARGSRCWRGRGWPTSTARCPRSTRCARAAVTRADVDAAARRASTSPCSCPTPSRTALVAWRARHPRALGLRDRRPRRCCSRARCRVPAAVRGRSQVYYYRAMLEGLGLDVDGPARRVARVPRGVARARRRPSSAATGPGSASTPGPSSAPRSGGCPSASPPSPTSWPGASARTVAIVGRRRRSGRSAEAIAGAAARRPRASCAARRPSASSSACSRACACCSPTTRARCTSRPPSARRSSRSSARPTGARRRPSAARAAVVREDVDVRALPAARVPDRPPLHDARRRRPRGRGGAGAARGMSAEPRPAIFMDRDGTLSHEVGYVNHLARFRLYPWTVDAVRAHQPRRLAGGRGHEPGGRRARLLPGVADPRGARARCASASRRAARASTASTSACTIRRSASRRTGRTATAASRGPGMLQRAEAELGVDLARSWVVGDRHGDLQLAWNVGRARRAREDRLRPRRARPTTRRAGRGRPTSWPSTCSRRSSASSAQREARVSAPRARSGWLEPLVRALPRPARAGARRPRGRRVRLRPRASASAARRRCSSSQHDAHRRAARRRGERRPQHPHPRRRARCPSASSAATSTAGALRRAPAREGNRRPRGVVDEAGYATPVKTPHPRRRRALDEAADRAHRPLRTAARRAAPRRARGARARCAPIAGPVDGVLVSDYGFGLAHPRAGARGRRLRPPAPGARSPSTRASRCSRFRGMTAVTPERARGRGGARGHDRPRPRAARGRRARRCSRRLGLQGRARHPRQRRHGPLRARAGRRCTSPSTAPTRWPTSPAPATP